MSKMMNLIVAKKAIELMANADNTIPDHDGSLYDLAAFAAWHALGSAHQEVLKQLLFHGPVYDGDIISKSHRDDLILLGMAVLCCYKGEQGYTAAAYRSHTIYQTSIGAARE